MLRGLFLCPESEVIVCQKVQRSPAHAQAVPISLMDGIVKSTVCRSVASMISMSEVPTLTGSTAELGSVSATAMLQRTLFVRCVSRKAG